MPWLPHLLALLVVGPALADRWLFSPSGRGSDARYGVYGRILAWQWLASAAILLGCGPEKIWTVPAGTAALRWLPPAWSAVAAALLFVAAVSVPVLRRPQSGSETMPLWPKGGAEQAAWALVAVTSGVCEEIMFRGFLLSYGHAFPWHWAWPAAIGASCLAFGLGHLYQGAGSALRAAAAGLLFCGLFLASGSLWLPVLTHVAADLAGFLPTRRQIGVA
ncbi:MAG TPA: CPBP family intramembrane glutamic endopeptidase [Opitutaceae bacterium]|jgi:membrane protease YdiL (CAAX protease family)|nr:CPBP family intramembrane glutamic endopeptidase [Opitutaceae bacterium]